MQKSVDADTRRTQTSRRLRTGTLLLAVLLLAFACLLCVAQVAITPARAWSVPANMLSEINPNESYGGWRLPVEPIRPEVLTPPPWRLDDLLTPSGALVLAPPLELASLPTSIPGPDRSPSPRPTGGPSIYLTTTSLPPTSMPTAISTPIPTLRPATLTYVPPTATRLPPTVTVAPTAQPTPWPTETDPPEDPPTSTRPPQPTARPSSTPVPPTVTVGPTDTPAEPTATATPTQIGTPTSTPTGIYKMTATPTETPTSTPGPPSNPLHPILECVTDNGDGTYTAFWSYLSNNHTPIMLPVGPGNQFTPLPADRGQPTTFLPGHQNFVFSVVWDGSDLTWELDTRTATASSKSGPCAKPTLTATPKAE